MGAILTVSRLWFAAYQAFDQRKLGDDPDWISYFDAWELARKAVHCFQDLGQPRGTLLFIGQAIDPPTPARIYRYGQRGWRVASRGPSRVARLRDPPRACSEMPRVPQDKTRRCVGPGRP